MDLNKVTTYSAAMFDRIKSAAKNATVTAVSATVNAVGAVSSLVGNPLTKDFEVGKQVASFGPNLAWRIYEGKKRTTGQVRNVYLLLLYVLPDLSLIFILIFQPPRECLSIHSNVVLCFKQICIIMKLCCT